MRLTRSGRTIGSGRIPVLTVLLLITTAGCARHYAAPPPPETVWFFFEPVDPEEASLQCSVAPRWEGGIVGLMPMYYDSKDAIVICGTRREWSGLFITPGYAKDAMVGYLRGKEEVRGTGAATQPGVWVKFRLLGSRAEDPRVAVAIERNDQRFKRSEESE